MAEVRPPGLSPRYLKARTVTRTEIAIALGWSMNKCKSRLWGKRWIAGRYRVGPHLYNAELIDVLRQLYRQEEPSTKAERDWLSAYQKNRSTDDRAEPGQPAPPGP